MNVAVGEAIAQNANDSNSDPDIGGQCFVLLNFMSSNRSLFSR